MSGENTINADELKVMPLFQHQELFVQMISELDDMAPCLTKILQEINYVTIYQKLITKKLQLEMKKMNNMSESVGPKNINSVAKGKSSEQNPISSDTKRASVTQIAGKKDEESRALTKQFIKYQRKKAKEEEKFHCDIKGDIKRSENTYGNIFTDYNYGDMVLVFENSLGVFQEKEIKMAITDTFNTTDPKFFASLVKSGQNLEIFRQAEITKTFESYKKTYLADQSFIDQTKSQDKNKKFVDAFQVYKEFQININLDNEQIPDSYLEDERNAFLNALLYYSTWCYPHDIENIDSPKSPFNPDWKASFKKLMDINCELQQDYNTPAGAIINEASCLFFQKDMQAKRVYNKLKDIDNENNQSLNKKFKAFALDLKVKKEKFKPYETEFKHSLKNEDEWTEFFNNFKTLDWAQKLNKDHPKNAKDNQIFPLFLIDVRLSKHLLKKIIILRLKKLNIYCREFYIAGLTQSAVIIKTSKQLLSDLAFTSKLNKEKELGHVDQCSIEPVDSQKRPFRLRDKKFRQMVEYKTQLERTEGKVEEEGADEDQQGVLSISSTNVHILKQLVKEIEMYHPANMYTQITNQFRQNQTLLREIGQQCRYDVPGFESEIRTEKTLDRSDMYAPFLFNSYVNFMNMNLKEYSRDKQVQEYFPFIHRIIFQKAREDGNRALKKWQWYNCCCPKQIEHVWSNIDSEPMPPYEIYKHEASSVQKWRTYEINELGHRNVFPRMERVKLTSNIINEVMKVSNLMDIPKFFVDVIPLHDNWLLKGDEQEELFENVIPSQFQLMDTDLKQQSVFTQLKGGIHDPRDFVTTYLKDCYSPSSDYDNEKDLKMINMYFGERVTLYTRFNNFYSKWLMVFGIISIIYFIPQTIFSLQQNYKVWKYQMGIFSLMIVVFTSCFVEYWRCAQLMFALEYGQVDFEKNQSIRPQYKGSYQRDYASEDNNKITHDKGHRMKRQCITTFFSQILILISVATSIYLLQLKKILMDKGVPDNISAIIPSILNAIAVGIYSTIYEYHIVVPLTLKENYRTRTELEDSQILKLFSFNFINFANSLVIIAVLKEFQEESFGKCIPPSNNMKFYVDYHLRCYGEQEIQIYINIAVGLLGTWLLPWVQWKQHHRAINSELRHTINLERVYEWGKVDAIIEDELKMETFNKTYEIDQIILEYSALFKQLSMMFMFGATVPAGWICCSFSNYVSRTTFMNKLLLFTKRPTPRGAEDIGSWETIMQIANIIGIFFSAGLCGYCMKVFEHDNVDSLIDDKTKVNTFYIFVFIGLFIRVLAYLLIPETQGNYLKVLRRQKNITALIQNNNFLSQTQRSGMPMTVPDYIEDRLAKSKKTARDKKSEMLEQQKKQNLDLAVPYKSKEKAGKYLLNINLNIIRSTAKSIESYGRSFRRK